VSHILLHYSDTRLTFLINCSTFRNLDSISRTHWNDAAVITSINKPTFIALSSLGSFTTYSYNQSFDYPSQNLSSLWYSV